MLNIVVINGGNSGSTGKIINDIRECGKRRGYQFTIFTPTKKAERKVSSDNYFIGSRIERCISRKVNEYSGYLDSFNYYNTVWLIYKIKSIRPDVIHLHNIHGNYINIKIFFRFLKKLNIPVVWTLHDCWAFTGQCSHYTIAKCENWMNHCMNCPNINNYPFARKDHTYELFALKKKIFTGLNKMTIITPSRWLFNEVKKSFLSNYSTLVINNGIDLNIFKPQLTDFKKKYCIEDKFVILSVAPLWLYSKGIDRIMNIAKKLDSRFKIVIVGLKNVKSKKIITIPRTNNQEELAKIYSAADLFFNPTREDTFPTVNLEALACGTPVISYGACGSAEAFDKRTGTIVNDDNILKIIEHIYSRNYDTKDCILRAKLFEKEKIYNEYIELYDKVTRC